MKKIFIIFSLVLAMGLFFTGCSEENGDISDNDNGIITENKDQNSTSGNNLTSDNNITSDSNTNENNTSDNIFDDVSDKIDEAITDVSDFLND